MLCVCIVRDIESSEWKISLWHQKVTNTAAWLLLCDVPSSSFTKESLSNGDLKARSGYSPSTTLVVVQSAKSHNNANNTILCSLKEFLPGSYMKANRIERKIFGEHKALQGLSELDAKSKYVKKARELPTFGVHFFLVKVRELHFYRIWEDAI